ncbi:MAG: hypothetical protein AAGL66_04360, partial [Pseudomonadota bacterium]
VALQPPPNRDAIADLSIFLPIKLVLHPLIAWFVVVCRDRHGVDVARGLSNYDAVEVRSILGCSSKQIAERLGYGGEAEVVHRDNMVLL